MFDAVLVDNDLYISWPVLSSPITFYTLYVLIFSLHYIVLTLFIFSAVVCDVDRLGCHTYGNCWWSTQPSTLRGTVK